jgi:HSP20 family protein
MAEVATKLPVKTEKKAAEPTSATQAWWPVEGLRREIDRLFDDFGMRSWSSPFRRSIFGVEPFCRRELSWTGAPAVDITESDKAYEVTAELPGWTRRTSR